jgi:hypothetical protein
MGLRYRGPFHCWYICPHSRNAAILQYMFPVLDSSSFVLLSFMLEGFIWFDQLSRISIVFAWSKTE